jgi:arylsulfatase A-like enzyme
VPSISRTSGRRGLVASVGVALLTGIIVVASESRPSETATALQTAARPNILWITSEDNGPEIGAYGDTYATTPNIDRLAARGFRYRHVWSNGPVCGASRTALILGVHPASTGGEHMRSYVPLPADMRLYPALLRDAGYYTTNNAKTDYNYGEVGPVWDASSATAHYKNRKPGQPFFAVFNVANTHESQIRMRPHTWVHDVARAPVPPYMPDTKETREDWAQYYDRITDMDAIVGQRLAELEAAGLAEDTIVMYFGDHGAGLPRSKRSPYNSGLRVPLVVYVPPKYRHLAPADVAQAGAESTRLVSFVDFAPTLLSLAGVKPPDWMQGRAFMGPHTAGAPAYLFGFRGRMDERYDLVRSVRDARYVYVRNFMPHRPHGQHVGYMFETPTTAVWKRMFEAGALNPVQRAFFEPKATEELYDLDADRWETRNLAALPEHASTLARFRQALDAHVRATHDIGFLPEYEIHRGEAARAPADRARDGRAYNLEAVYQAAMNASDRSVPLARVRPGLSSGDSAVRYWAATGVLVRGAVAVADTRTDLVRLLGDAEPGPRAVAAEALGRFGSSDDRARAITVLLRDADPVVNGEFAALFAAYSLNQISDLSDDVKKAVQALPATPADAGRKLRAREDYLPRIKAAIAAGVR